MRISIGIWFALLPITFCSLFAQGQSPIVQTEHLQLLTNGSMFVPGESVLFKVRIFTNTSSDESLSTVAYIEVIDEDGKSIIQHKIFLADGEGSGEIELPFYLESGNYTIIAYTRWMRNFPASYFHRQEITIVNPLKPSHELHLSNITQKPEVRFFPGAAHPIGGNAVTMGFEITGSDEAIRSAQVVDESEGLVVESTQLTDRSGYFEYTPASGKHYKLAISFGEEPILYDITPPANSRYKLLLDESNDKVIIRVSHATAINPKLSYDLWRNGVPVKRAIKPVRETTDETVIAFPRDSLYEALYTLVVNDPNHGIVAQKKFFNKKRHNIGQVTSARRKYVTRDKVLLRVSLPEDEVVTATLNVRLLDSAEIRTRRRMASGENASVLDRLRSSASSDDQYESRSQLQDLRAHPNQTEKIGFLPDLRGQLLAGRIIEAETGKAVNGANVFITAKGNGGYLFAALSNDDGHFYCNTLTYRPLSELWLSVSPEKAKDFTVITVPEYVEQHHYFAPEALQLDSTFEKDLRKRIIYSQIQHAYNEPDMQSMIGPSAVGFFGRPDKVYRLDDFTRFPTMEDIFREFVPEVVVRKRPGSYSIVLINPLNGRRHQAPPLTILDGFPIFDTNTLMQYDQAKIQSIDILSGKYRYSSLEMDGVLSLTTYDGNGAALSLDNAKLLPYTPFRNAKYKNGPDYSAQNIDLTRIPDYRVQLYWHPELPPSGDADVQFYTSDVTGDFICELIALTKHGEFIYDSTIITVENDKDRK